MHQRKSKPTLKTLMARLSKGSKTKVILRRRQIFENVSFFYPNNQHERNLQDFSKGTPKISTIGSILRF